MRSYTQNKPIGADAATDFAQRQQARANLELQLYDSETVKIQRTTRGIRFHAKINNIVPQSGWRWQKPYTEGDASLFIPAGVAINLSNENTLVTTGLTDLVTGELVKAIPGAWLALQDIPKSDGTNWNMPMPASQAGADGSVTGSAGSLKGDLDNPDVFWFYLDGNLNCG